MLISLRDIAQADAPRLAGAAVLSAVAFHVAIQGVELEQYIFHFLASCLLSFAGLVYIFVRYQDCDLVLGLAKSSLVATAFHASLLASITFYRLILHRCRRFPGPVGARLSRFYAAWQSAKNVQYYKELRAMHDLYGDFVRTGPREITILRKSAVDIIYGLNSECRKSTWYGQAGYDPEKVSVNLTRDPLKERLRRRAWDKGVSIKALATYEPRIKEKADLLVYQLKKHQGQTVNMTDWSMCFSFDLIGEVGLGKDFGQLKSGKAHSAIGPIHTHIKTLGILSTVPWLLHLIGCLPGATSSYVEIMNFCTNEIISKQKSWNSGKYPSDIASWLIKAMKEKDVSAAPSQEALNEDARLLFLAGSDTTATTLTHALYHLAKYQETQKKLQQLLDHAVPGGYGEWTWEKVRTVAYLDDYISETLRLKPALMSGTPRETPAGGVQIDEVHIPEKTNVIVSISQMHRDPRYWQQADEFIPERWSERHAEMGTGKAPYFPFSLGNSICPGRNLARLSLRIAISLIMINFDVSFAPGETGEVFDQEVLDTFTVTLPPLQLQFSPRQEKSHG